MKKINSLIKVVSVMVIVSLCASLVTACNGQKDDRTDFTTRTTETVYDPDISEPNQTIDTMSPDKTTETAGSTTAPTGKYTYTVYAGTEYETTLSMDINIDDHLIDNGEKSPFFSVGYLGDALGWIGNGDPNYDGKDPLIYYAYVYGDTQMVFRYEDTFGSADNPSGFAQLYGFSCHLAPISDYLADARTSEEIKTSDANYGIYITFGQHSDSLCYHTAGNKGIASGISRDDAILIAYIFASAITRPGENPFVGTNLENAIVRQSEDYLVYNLP